MVNCTVAAQVVERWSQQQVLLWAAQVACLRDADSRALSSATSCGRDLVKAGKALSGLPKLSQDATSVLRFVVEQGHWAWVDEEEEPD